MTKQKLSALITVTVLIASTVLAFAFPPTNAQAAPNAWQPCTTSPATVQIPADMKWTWAENSNAADTLTSGVLTLQGQVGADANWVTAPYVTFPYDDYIPSYASGVDITAATLYYDISSFGGSEQWEVVRANSAPPFTVQRYGMAGPSPWVSAFTISSTGTKSHNVLTRFEDWFDDGFTEVALFWKYVASGDTTYTSSTISPASVYLEVTYTCTATVTPSPTLTPSPTSTPLPTGIDVWQLGNYVADDSFEGINWFEDFFNPRWKTFAFGIGTFDDPLCGSRYAEFRAADLIGGETYAIQPVGVTQEILWWGGDMYVTFGYRTAGEGAVNAYLIDPFNRQVELGSNLQSEDEWTVFVTTVPDQILGAYRLVIAGTAINFTDQIHIDAVSISEGGYYHCEYNQTPISPPLSPALPQTLITDPGTESTEGLTPDWIASSDNAVVYGTGATAVLGIFGPAVGPDDVLDPIWTQGIDDAFAKSEDWIDVLEDELNARKGFLPEKSYATLSHVMAVSYIISDMDNNIVALQSVETGEIITANDANCLATGEFVGFFEGYNCTRTFEVQPGRYRLRVGFEGQFTETVYISRVCVAAAEFIITTQSCDGVYVPPPLFENATLDAMAAQVTAHAATTQTALAAVQVTQAYGFALTATPAAAITQTALVASGNTTAIARATQTQIYALTRTPAIAASRTAWVNQWRGTLTAAAAATATHRAQNATALAQGSVNATAQAIIRNTAYAQATQSAQLTAIVYHQATLVQASTQQAQNIPTVYVQGTAAAATLSAAQTALAGSSNATTQAQATAAAQQQQQIATQIALNISLQQTVLAQLTAQPNINATLQYQATLIQQQQQTLIATLQAAATQQVLQLPPDQPMPEELDPDLGCTRPDNPLNLAWWIDYEVCRILWYVTWNGTNTQQVFAIGTQAVQLEPYGTINEVGSLVQDVEEQVSQYDWADTGFEGSDDPLPQIIADPNAQAESEGVIIIGSAEDIPLFNAEFAFGDETLGYAFATTCQTKLDENLGPYLSPPLCFLMDITRRTGWLPFARLLFDLGAIFLLVRYYWGWFLEMAGEQARQTLREPTPGEQPPAIFNNRRRP